MSYFKTLKYKKLEYIQFLDFNIKPFISEKCIREIPMTTFEKSHYALGDKLELVRKGHRPPSRGFLAVNAKKLAMIATRLAQTGFYSPIEEEKEARLEMEMVRPCAKYGTAVNTNARPLSDAMDQARKSQIAATQAIRAVSVYGETSLYSGT